MGLVKLSEGSITVLGHSPGSRLALKNSGCLIERPSFIPRLSAYDNLRVLAAARGLPTTRIGEVLDIVGLADRAKDSFRSYSLGMGQRLGIAAALLGAPKLLILDEPTSGLDPDGVVDVRTLVRELADQGVTVVLSSHLLDEVERTCDRVALLNSGSVIAHGTLDTLRAASSPHTKLAVDDVSATQHLLSTSGYRVIAADHTLGEVDVAIASSEVSELVRELVAAGIGVTSVKPIHNDLEHIFFNLVRESEVAR